MSEVETNLCFIAIAGGIMLCVELLTKNDLKMPVLNRIAAALTGIVTLGSAGLIVQYDFMGLQPGQSLYLFYATSSMFLAWLASLCFPAGLWRIAMVSVGIALAATIVSTDAVLKGYKYIPGFEFPTRDKGDFYWVYLVAGCTFAASATYGFLLRLGLEPSPAARNRLWANLYAITPIQIVTFVLAWSMLYDIPPITGPEILPYAFAAFVFALALANNPIGLPCMAPPWSKDRALHRKQAEELRALKVLQSVTPAHIFEQILEQRLAVAWSDPVTTISALNSDGRDAGIPVLDNYCWTKELARLGAGIVGARAGRKIHRFWPEDEDYDAMTRR